MVNGNEADAGASAILFWKCIFSKPSYKLRKRGSGTENYSIMWKGGEKYMVGRRKERREYT